MEVGSQTDASEAFRTTVVSLLSLTFPLQIHSSGQAGIIYQQVGESCEKPLE